MRDLLTGTAVMSQFHASSKSIDIDDGESYADEVPVSRSARASQSITALGEMTAGLAHDFRNILATIDARISLAERNPNDPDKVKAALGAAHEDIRRGSRLASQLLLFAKSEKPSDHPEDVNDLLDGLKTFLKYGAGSPAGRSIA